MCSSQSCCRRSCSKTCYKWHVSPLAALAREVLGGRPVGGYLPPAVLLLPSPAHCCPNAGRRVVAVRHVRLSDASAGAGRTVLAIGLAAGDLHAVFFHGGVWWSAPDREVGFGSGKSDSSGAVHAAVCFLIVGRSFVNRRGHGKFRQIPRSRRGAEIYQTNMCPRSLR
jgi:hypothetical protein